MSRQKDLQHLEMQGCKPSKAPSEKNRNQETAEEDPDRIDAHAIRSLVYPLLYIAKQTRPHNIDEKCFIAFHAC